MIKAVVFDLDGVLVSTDRLHYAAWKQLADRLAIPFDETVNSRLRGISRRASLEIILAGADYTEAEKQAFAAEKNRQYCRAISAMTPADVGQETRRLLEELRARGILLAVGSGSKNALAILRRVALVGNFDAVVDGTMITRPKPDPEVFLMAAAALGVRPAEAAVVEDAAAGITAAKAGGFWAVGMGQVPGADRTIESLQDLPAALRLQK